MFVAPFGTQCVDHLLQPRQLEDAHQHRIPGSGKRSLRKRLRGGAEGKASERDDICVLGVSSCPSLVDIVQGGSNIPKECLHSQRAASRRAP
jgi:hypothetical protein